MLRQPQHKYPAFVPLALPDRQWPNQITRTPPVWLSTDLRDGNQALIEPMAAARKRQLFALLVEIGFKEIEVAFPSASQTDFDFVRQLIEQDAVPADVTLSVLTQSREDLIARTIQALHGVRRAIVHLYNPIAPAFRRIVFNSDRAGVKALAVRGAEQIRALTARCPDTEWVFEYSPETFSACEPEFALEVCDAVSAVWQPTPQHKMIINLPATVELSTPNTYADQIEYFIRHLPNRDAAIISVHPHNDRGTGVACAELSMLAGADRVEGTLFGNGERTGNMDIVTMALNLFSQGVDPQLDFTNINHVRDVYKECKRMEIHPRHPYVGELVYTAFSGSHQDAINKGMSAQETRGSSVWAVPYLPIDPQDVGRTYQSIIRINSQSGKGGVAYIMEREFGFKMPKSMHPEFGRVIQHITDETGEELPPQRIWEIFEQEYLKKTYPYHVKECHIAVDATEEAASATTVKAVIAVDGSDIRFESKGNGPIDAFMRGFNERSGVNFALQSYSEHDIDHGSDSRAAAYISIKNDAGRTAFGVGVDANINIASIKAILSALNRLAA